jgi:hypothetical protein
MRAGSARYLRTLRDQGIRLRDERFLDVEARVWEAVVRSLMNAANATERMKRRDKRRPERFLHAQSHEA